MSMRVWAGGSAARVASARALLQLNNTRVRFFGCGISILDSVLQTQWISLFSNTAEDVMTLDKTHQETSITACIGE